MKSKQTMTFSTIAEYKYFNKSNREKLTHLFYSTTQGD